MFSDDCNQLRYDVEKNYSKAFYSEPMGPPKILQGKYNIFAFLADVK